MSRPWDIDDPRPEPSFGIVVIGRNEGDRLRHCFDGIGSVPALVYVDSGSTDGSIPLATERGAIIVALELDSPFTAARARNAGFRRLKEVAAELRYVQFVDGDCELSPDWIGTAVRFLDEHADVAVVCGRLRERYPERSLYNRLCDIEWNRPPGEVQACGGLAMMRARAFQEVGGFNPALTAGEEADLCIRLRARGGRIWKLDVDMALHDAAMTHLSQWWRRAMRGGYAAAEGLMLHEGASGAAYRRRLVRIAMWVVAWPLLTICLTFSSWWWLLLLAAYPTQMTRLVLRARHLDPKAWPSGIFHVLANFPEAAGAIKYFVDRFGDRDKKVIEYR